MTVGLWNVLRARVWRAFKGRDAFSKKFGFVYANANGWGRVGGEVGFVHLALKPGYFVISGELFFGRSLECPKAIV